MSVLHMASEGHGGGSSLPEEEFIWKEPPMTWFDLVPSLFSGGCACVCVCAQSWGFAHLSNRCPLEDRTALPPVAHSVNVTDSFVQLSAKKEPTSKVQIPDCRRLLSVRRWQRRSGPAHTKAKQMLNCPSHFPLLLMFVSTTLCDLHSTLLWTQLDVTDCHSNNLICSGMTQSYCSLFCRHFKRNLYIWALHASFLLTHTNAYTVCFTFEFSLLCGLVQRKSNS